MEMQVSVWLNVESYGFFWGVYHCQVASQLLAELSGVFPPSFFKLYRESKVVTPKVQERPSRVTVSATHAWKWQHGLLCKLQIIRDFINW